MNTETFKEFFSQEPVPYHFSDLEVANMYFHNSSLSVREISRQTTRSIGEVYRILKQYGNPNRLKDSHRNSVISLSDSGMPIKTIADMTGYTPRHVRNILKERQ